jgi:hypothetical protein
VKLSALSPPATPQVIKSPQLSALPTLMAIVLMTLMTTAQMFTIFYKKTETAMVPVITVITAPMFQTRIKQTMTSMALVIPAMINRIMILLRMNQTTALT